MSRLCSGCDKQIPDNEAFLTEYGAPAPAEAVSPPVQRAITVNSPQREKTALSFPLWEVVFRWLGGMIIDYINVEFGWQLGDLQELLE